MSDSVFAQPRKKRSRKKLYIIIAIAVVLLGAVAAVAAKKRGEKPIPITTEKAFRKTITQLVTATGKIQPEVETKIAPEVSGEIIELPVREGQIVHRGDLLMRIRPDSYRAQVESQEAALSGAKAASVQHRAELAKAEQDYKRIKSLYDQHLVSESDRNAAQTSYDIAKAALETSLFDIQRSEGALKQINDALSKTVIHSPSDGSISSLPARVMGLKTERFLLARLATTMAEPSGR